MAANSEVKCPNCGHVLIRINERMPLDVEAKCNSCKAIVRITTDLELVVHVSTQGRKFPPQLETK